MAEQKDDATKIREEQQRQEDEKKKQEEENKKQRDAAIKRMEESVPTPTPEEVDKAILAQGGGGEINPALRKTSEAAPTAATYQTRQAKPKEVI
jgi:hypothetical protein